MHEGSVSDVVDAVAANVDAAVDAALESAERRVDAAEEAASAIAQSALISAFEQRFETLAKENQSWLEARAADLAKVLDLLPGMEQLRTELAETKAQLATLLSQAATAQPVAIIPGAETLTQQPSEAMAEVLPEAVTAPLSDASEAAPPAAAPKRRAVRLL